MNFQEHEDAAEQWLNEAIEHFQRAGPRTGLEARILANLRARARQQQRRWTFALAAVASAAALAIAFAMSFSRERQAEVPNATQWNSTQAGSIPIRQMTSNCQPEKMDHRHVRARRDLVPNHIIINRAVKRPAVGVNQEMFPSSAPLTEQGRLLQAYLRRTPHHELALIAARQSSSPEIKQLNIPPIEIQDLSPMENGEKTGEPN